MGAGRRAAIAVLGAAIGLACPCSAQALDVSINRTFDGTWAGDGCGSRDTFDARLPKGARKPALISPRPGANLRADGKSVATVAVRRLRSAGRTIFRVTATGSDDVCASPQNYADFGWVADAGVRVRYRIKRNVYFRSEIMGSPTALRFKPRTVLFGERSGIQGVRWSRWNGPKARGRGSLLYNDCNPNCAQARPQYFPVRLVLFRVRQCGPRLRYTSFSFSYTGAKPPGLPRSYKQRFGCL